MDSGFDETPQEGAAGASVALASERKVPTLSAVEDLDGAANGRQRLAGVQGFRASRTNFWHRFRGNRGSRPVLVKTRPRLSPRISCVGRHRATMTHALEVSDV